ncbi:beta-hexosaminidase [Abditibacteriota bacterium]|nr:beta-hexosaminidase [Abditibacteriota bacterium]
MHRMACVRLAYFSLLPLATTLGGVATTVQAQTMTAPQLVPRPAQMALGQGTFTLSKKSAVEALTPEEKSEAAFFAASIAPATGFAPAVDSRVGGRRADAINFRIDPASGLGDEGYHLQVTPHRVLVVAQKPAGLFYAGQTLRQLLPTAIFAPTVQKNVVWQMPVVSIEDKPRFAWRGLMLDSGRHFFPIPAVKRFIDLMAQQKLNIFHWHLTEDQGWRLEIKKYPKLTEVGSVRAESPGQGARNKGDGTPYRGFYTQAEARDVVAYAAQRHITVIPEIEMPGHASAAITAYPQLGNTDVPDYAPQVQTRWGVFPYTYAPKEETFAFLEDVLREVMAIFPSKIIHIGGDEAPKTQWDKSPFARDFMAKNGLKDSHELQSYFITRMEKFLNANGRQIIGWDEILEGGLAPNASVMSWRGESGAVAASNQNHPVVMASNGAYYLDYGQGRGANEPETIGGFVPLRRVYTFDPTAALAPEKVSFLRGVQGQLWAEYIADLPKLEYQAYPRACALAETGWSPAQGKDYADFRARLQTHVERLRAQGVNFRPLDVEGAPVGTWKSGEVGQEWVEKTWDISSSIAKAGTYDVTFQYTEGEHRLDISWAQLEQNGKVLARDEHTGLTGGATKDNVYHLVVPALTAGEKVLLRARVRADGGSDSNGEISVKSG